MDLFEDLIIDADWLSLLSNCLKTPESENLSSLLKSKAKSNINILPDKTLWFNALNTTPLKKVKVVILGQDPYPTVGHAHGLAFSVEKEVLPLPKSLKNIYKELETDLGIKNTHGNLQAWAEQGVLLLNSVLTVEAGNANSHQGLGWERITDEIITCLNAYSKTSIIFVLWGASAQKKGKHIDEEKHLVLRAPHPSPLSSYRGFFGSKPFSTINKHLAKNGQQTIDWRV